MLVWSFEQITFYIGSLRANLILACQEVRVFQLTTNIKVVFNMSLSSFHSLVDACMPHFLVERKLEQREVWSSNSSTLSSLCVSQWNTFNLMWIYCKSDIQICITKHYNNFSWIMHVWCNYIEIKQRDCVGWGFYVCRSSTKL